MSFPAVHCDELSSDSMPQLSHNTTHSCGHHLPLSQLLDIDQAERAAGFPGPYGSDAASSSLLKRWRLSLDNTR